MELYTVPDEGSNQNIPLFLGEVIDPDINGRDVMYICPYSNEYSGHLFVTNFKLYFRSTDRTPLLIYLPLGTISKIEKFGGTKTKGDNAYGIHIVCKDVRSVKFALNPENHSRRDVFEKLKQHAFPLSNKAKLFCFDVKVSSLQSPILFLSQLVLFYFSSNIPKTGGPYIMLKKSTTVSGYPKRYGVNLQSTINTNYATHIHRSFMFQQWPPTKCSNQWRPFVVVEDCLF